MTQPVTNDPRRLAPQGVGRAPPAEVSGRATPVLSTFGSFERQYYLGAARGSDVADPVALDHLLARLDEKSYAVLSVDVFDTLMLRNGKCERRRFWEIAERWRRELPPKSRGPDVLDLYLARLRAAQICYTCGPIAAGTQEGRLDNIIGTILSLLNLPRDLVPKFMDIELEYDGENLTPNPLVLAMLEAYGGQGGRVMLLSDMYLSGSQIYEIMCKFDLGGVAPYIYSSADITLNKRSGTIFIPAAQNLGVAAADILHVGDNFIPDVAMPRLAGWAAQHLPVPACEERIREADERAFAEALGDVGA
jgi:FMN phosphatase YigB (HAD superfamily)